MEHVSDADALSHVFSAYATNETTRHKSERLILVVSRADKENSWFGKVELTVHWHGLQVFIVTLCFAPYPHTGSGN